MCLAKRAAIEIIVKCNQRGFELEYFKLQRLAYICQCVHYKVYGVPLFPEKIWKWDNGGAVKEIYAFITKKLDSYISFPIEKIKKIRDEMDDLLLFEEKTIDFVIDNYGNKSLKELVDLIFEEPYYKKIEYGDRIRLENLNYYFISDRQADDIRF